MIPAPPPPAAVHRTAHLLYDRVAETGDGRVLVGRCRRIGRTSRACDVRITGDAPIRLVLRLRRTRNGDFYAYASSPDDNTAPSGGTRSRP